MNYITAEIGSHKGSRLGHQAIDLIAALIISEWFGYKYLHQPFRNAAEQWNKYLDFGLGEEQYTSHNEKERIEIVRKPGSIESPEEVEETFTTQKDNVVFVLRWSARILLHNLYYWGKRNLHQRIRDKLRVKYWGSPCIRGKSKVGGVGVVLRRGADLQRWPQQITPTSYFLAALEYVEKTWPDLPITIYTDVQKQEVESQLHRYNIHSCENSFPEIVDILHALVTADVLVGSTSAFSNIAGYLHEGVFIEPKSWLDPDPNSIKF